MLEEKEKKTQAMLQEKDQDLDEKLILEEKNGIRGKENEV